MKSPVRLTGLGVFIGVLALISLIYILFADFFVAKSIRTAGSQLVGAQVDLDSANLDLGEELLALNKLAVTNPKNPMTNAVQADYLEVNLDASALTWNKVIVDNIEITNLFFNTPRETSGELTEHWSDISDWQPLADIQGLEAMTADNLPDASEIIAQEELETLTAIDSFTANLAAAETDLKQQLANLPDEAKIADYQKRLKELKDSGGSNLLGLLSKGKEFKELRKEIKADLDALKAFKNTLQTQRKQLGAELSNLKTLPQKDLDRLKQKYSFSGDGVSNLVNSVLGPQIGGWVTEGYGYYQLVQPYLSQMESGGESDVQSSQVLTDRGRKVIFADENPLPDYLIKAINIASPENKGQLGISGNIKNLTTQPQRWDEPLDVQLQGTAPFLNLFALTGVFDRRHEAQSLDKVNLQISGLDLVSATDELTATTPGMIETTAGVVDIKAEMTLENKELASQIRLNFKNLALQSEAAEPWVATVIAGLSKLPEFEVVIDLTGDITQPETAISSPDLSKLSAEVMRSLLSDELQDFENSLMEQIRGATDSPLSNLPGLDGLESIQEQLNLKELDLNKVLKGLG